MIIELDADHRLILVSSPYEKTDDDVTLATACGAIEEHPSAKDGSPCSGYIHFRGRPDARGQGRPSWVIEQEEPLTLSPSILCHCGRHGFVRDGKWAEA